MKKNGVLAALLAAGLVSGNCTAFAAGISGEFSASAKGFGGDVSVTLTLRDGKLAEVKAEGKSETPGIGSRALELMPAAMVAANSIGVDTVSGATFTSKAILEAAEAALA